MSSIEVLFLGELAQNVLAGREASLVTRGNPSSITESRIKNVFTMPIWRVKEFSLKDI